MNNFLKLIKKAIKKFFVIQVTVFSTVFAIMFGLVFTGAFFASLGEVESVDAVPTYKVVAGEDSSDTAFLSIPVKGIILGEPTEPETFFAAFADGIVFGYEIKEKLKDAAEDDTIDGVILEIDSPGGTIFGSQAIADGVEYYKNQTGNPVYSFVAGVAASGGYWVAAGTDYIIADHGTVTGSIGVISGPFKQYSSVTSEGGLFYPTIVTQDGIETSYITAGEYKDLGNPFREMSEEERQSLQQAVSSSYQDFVTYVAKSREIDESQVTDSIKALIYSEHQAKELQLIDAIGSKDTAYQMLSDSVSAGEFKILREDSAETLMDVLTSAVAGKIAPQATTLTHVGTQALCDASVVMAFHGDPIKMCGL